MKQGQSDITLLSPERIVGLEQGALREVEIALDSRAGMIAHIGGRGDMREWLEGEERRCGPLAVDEICGGVVMPTLTEAHNHPAFYSMLDVAKPGFLYQAKNLEDVKRVLLDAKTDKEDGEPVVLMNWNSAVIPDISRELLDEFSESNPVIVFDASMHKAIGNSWVMREYVEVLKEHDTAGFSGKVDYETGAVTSQYTFFMTEMMSRYYPIEKVAESIERNLDATLRSGVTAVHDLDPTTIENFMSYLTARRHWSETRDVEFPITQIYVRPILMARIIKEADSLVERGLLTLDELPQMGIKLFADGSFGAETALVSEAYGDTGHKGTALDQVNQLNKALEMAREVGLSKLAIHGIGDAGIQRAIVFAEAWIKMADEENLDQSRVRIEHIELPLPLEETLRKVKDLGIWAGPQPNFLIDWIYNDRLGEERTKWICPLKEFADRGIPMMFGTDGMPESMLYAVWCATHAQEGHQRLSFEQALQAASVAAGEYERTGRGKILPGCPADLMVVDPQLIAQLSDNVGSPGEQDWEDAVALKKKLEGNILQVFKAGKKV